MRTANLYDAKNRFRKLVDVPEEGKVTIIPATISPPSNRVEGPPCFS